MRQLLRVVGVLSLLATAVVLAQAAALPTLDTGLVTSPKEAKFSPAKTPHSEGVQQAPIAADPAPGGSIGYAKYAPGAGIPEHWHSATEYSTVLSGSMRLKLAGKMYELAPGSYWVAPPKTPHQLVCIGPGECLTQTRRAGPVDYNFVQ
jgi:quercetin dioxygenase-like cupin family protein